MHETNKKQGLRRGKATFLRPFCIDCEIIVTLPDLCCERYRWYRCRMLMNLVDPQMKSHQLTA